MATTCWLGVRIWLPVSVRNKGCVVLFVELRELVASEATARGQFRDFFEVPVLPARQRPVEHACWCRAYIFETMNGIARYEVQRTGAADRGLAVNRQFVKTIDDKENFLLIEVHMVGRAFAGLCHATIADMAPAVSSVVSRTFMSKLKGLMAGTCSGAAMTGWRGAIRVSISLCSGSLRPRGADLLRGIWSGPTYRIMPNDPSGSFGNP